MSREVSSKIWFYILFLPTVFSLQGLGIVYMSNVYEWGSELNIPATQLLGLFFAELTMVISGLGIVAFIKSVPKTTVINFMGLWNIVILVLSGINGYIIFMRL